MPRLYHPLEQVGGKLPRRSCSGRHAGQHVLSQAKSSISWLGSSIASHSKPLVPAMLAVHLGEEQWDAMPGFACSSVVTSLCDSKDGVSPPSGAKLQTSHATGTVTVLLAAAAAACAIQAPPSLAGTCVQVEIQPGEHRPASSTTPKNRASSLYSETSSRSRPA